MKVKEQATRWATCSLYLNRNLKQFFYWATANASYTPTVQINLARLGDKLPPEGSIVMA